LISAVACFLAAPRVYCALTRAVDGRM